MEISQCQTLREYRENILALPQAEVARRAKCKAAWVSFIERGHLPRAWNREALLKAYELSGAEFVRMVTNAAKLNAIQKPISETEPLMGCARTTPSVQQLYDGKLREAQQALLMQSEAKKARQA